MIFGATQVFSLASVRIEGKLKDGKFSSGTGFFFKFLPGSTEHYLGIVTNRHVVCNMSTAWIHLTHMTNTDAPDYGHHTKIQIDDFASKWVGHPDPETDLAVILITQVLDFFATKGERFAFYALGRELFLAPEVIRSLDVAQNIVMVGYPNNIWDSKNNCPIVRTGITATSIDMDYEGFPRFLIDAACIPGSSGSAIYIRGPIHKKDGNIDYGVMYALIGVLYGTYNIDILGEIKMVEIPTNMTPVAQSSFPIHLGVCIKAEAILRLDEALIRIGIRVPEGYLMDGSC
jgi:hypothetical protein